MEPPTDEQRHAARLKVTTRTLQSLGRQRTKVLEHQTRIQEAIASQTQIARDLGMSAPAIARELGITHQAVYDIIRKGTTQ